MLMVARKDRRKVRKKRVGKQLPRPEQAAHIRVEVSADEMAAINNAAHACGLSVSGFVRAAALETAAACAGESDTRRLALDEVVKRIIATAESTGRKKPGRPKKKIDAE